jgi:pimeloyl-ACP methyl ester carboxylesterase
MHSLSRKIIPAYISLSVVFILVASSTCWSQPDTPAKKSIYVIVHGAWGGSWAFKKVDSLITAHGHVVYRPSLTGQGERVHLASAEINLTTHVNDVVNMVLFENLRDIILVGHSYGGMVISGVADRIPDRIKKLVYLDAMVPNDGETVMNLMDPKGDRLKPMIQGDYVVPPWVKADQKPPKDVPHPLKTFTEPIVLKNAAARNISATYILTIDPGKKAEEDGFASSAQRARERGWVVKHMTADHNPQWSAPLELVERLLEVL